MKIREHFIQQFGPADQLQIATAPGRVNVIGEHTDYNDGLVFPVAIDKYVQMAGQLREDRVVRIYSVEMGEMVEFSLDQVQVGPDQPWANYPKGVLKLFLEKGYPLQGMDVVCAGEIPMGVGLASSAALEMATAYLIKKLHEIELASEEIIQLCQRAENEFVGVNCGIMDQYISCLGQADHGLMIDCRSLESQSVPLLNPDVQLIIANTNVRHELVESAYNERREECQEAVELINWLLGEEKESLREVTFEDFTQCQIRMPERPKKRAEHVVFENHRVLASVEMLKRGDYRQFGELMIDSHESLRVLYEVSCHELDLMVELACQVEGVYGSRMTGAGFGGCTVTLIRADQVDAFISYVGEHYQTETGIKPEFYVCKAVDGAERLNS